MRLALDTNAYSGIARGDAAIINVVERAESIAVPFVVVAELRAGFAMGTKGAVNERELSRFLALPDVTVLHSSDATLHHYARIYRQLRMQGTPVPTNDLWIAAMVIEHELTLCTRDTHFHQIPQIVLVP
jgi:tRNA(fMet)-specific endonuclease VapC